MSEPPHGLAPAGQLKVAREHGDRTLLAPCVLAAVKCVVLPIAIYTFVVLFGGEDAERGFGFIARGGVAMENAPSTRVEAI